MKQFHVHYYQIKQELADQTMTIRYYSWANYGLGIVDGEVEAVLNLSSPSSIPQRMILALAANGTCFANGQ